MGNNFKDKNHASVILMFKLLRLLSRGMVSHETIKDIFLEEFDYNESVARVTLNKYLNTLRILGFNVQKEGGNFYLKESLYRMELSEEDKEAFEFLKNIYEKLSSGKQKRFLGEFLAAFGVYCREDDEEMPERALTKPEQVEQAPQPFANNAMFKIRGSLIKSYRLKEGEVLQRVDEDGSPVIVSTKEDFDALLRRLLRYGACCEVIGPKSLRERMMQMIAQSADQYDYDDDELIG